MSNNEVHAIWFLDFFSETFKPLVLGVAIFYEILLNKETPLHNENA